MKTEGTVSVIVPVYNVAPYLARCVESLSGQTYHDLEILLIDDGSQDGSRAVMEECAKKDSRIRNFYQPHNMGVSAARNRGLDEATGYWVCFCDGDDWFLPDFIETLLAQAEKDDTDYVVCDYQVVSNGRPPMAAGTVSGLAGVSDIREVIACGPISSCTHLFRRELFTRSGTRYPVGCRQYEELPVIPVLAKTAARISVVDRALYCYYQRGDGTSASNAALDSENNFRTALTALREALGPGYEKELEFRAIYALFYGEILNLCKRGDSSAAIRKKLSAYEAEYPDYLKNPYLPHLGKAKRAFLQCAHRRFIPALRVFAKLHSILIK